MPPLAATQAAAGLWTARPELHTDPLATKLAECMTPSAGSVRRFTRGRARELKNGHNSVTVQNRTHVYMNFFHHKDLENHLLQLCPKVVKHPVYRVQNVFLRCPTTRLLCFLSSRISRKDRIRNVTIRQQIGLDETIIKGIEQNQLTWYDHVQRMAEERLPKIALKWMPKHKRTRGRPKKNWMEGIKKAMFIFYQPIKTLYFLKCNFTYRRLSRLYIRPRKHTTDTNYVIKIIETTFYQNNHINNWRTSTHAPQIQQYISLECWFQC